jgi:hypothetical protein
MTLNRPTDGVLRDREGESRSNRRTLAWTATALLGLLLFGVNPLSAGASLGGDAASVATDSSTLGAVNPSAAATEVQPGAASAEATVQSYILRASTGEKYTYNEFVTASNLRVREFLTPKGKVFGIAWQGPRTPDLQVLLGSYFPGWRDAVANQPHQSLHRSVIQTPSLVVRMAGAMGFVTGSAWAPRLVPAGVDARNVVK